MDSKPPKPAVWNPGETGSMPESEWRRLVVGQFDASENRLSSVDKKIDANTAVTVQVLEETREIRAAMARGRWIARGTAAGVSWLVHSVNLVFRWAAPIVAVVLAVLAYLGIKHGGPPSP